MLVVQFVMRQRLFFTYPSIPFFRRFILVKSFPPDFALPLPLSCRQLRLSLCGKWLIFALTCSFRLPFDTLAFSYVSAIYEEDTFYEKSISHSLTRAY